MLSRTHLPGWGKSDNEYKAWVQSTCGPAEECRTLDRQTVSMIQGPSPVVAKVFLPLGKILSLNCLVELIHVSRVQTVAGKKIIHRR